MKQKSGALAVMCMIGLVVIFGAVSNFWNGDMVGGSFAIVLTLLIVVTIIGALLERKQT